MIFMVYCSVLIPGRNEQTNVAILIPQIERRLSPLLQKEGFEIVVIEHCSTDRTYFTLQELQHTYSNLKICQITDRSIGLGDAFKIGFNHCRGVFILTMDGDRSHPPFFLPEFIRQFRSGHDVVIGGRYMRKQQPFNFQSRYYISKLFNLPPRIFINSQISDYTTGFRGFRRALLKRFPLKSKGFNLHIEINMKLVQTAHNPLEIPIQYIKRKHGESKLKYSKVFWGYLYAMLTSIRI